ncbi:MAG: hypothetical protein KAY32_15610 [Candidatus Eisenbacteria sp.]|nr:hypothetical protein [Candidatus Eisenbacteria bacterium]
MVGKSTVAAIVLACVGIMLALALFLTTVILSDSAVPALLRGICLCIATFGCILVAALLVRVLEISLRK